nr:MAG TPA: hypothetical protein [Caudoviricetes sp.]
MKNDILQILQWVAIVPSRFVLFVVMWQKTRKVFVNIF